LSGARPAPSRPLRFLWFGSYARGPGYPRSTVLIEGLRALGHEVRELHVPLFEDAGQRVSLARGGRPLHTAWRQAQATVKLAARWFRAEEHDVVVVGAGGLFDAPLVRFLQNVDRCSMVLDAFIPLYDTVVRDRGLAGPASRRARFLLRLERLSARQADLVLADTDQNAALLADDLQIDRSKLAVVPVAQADPGDPAPLPPEEGPLRVLLFSTYIPLHGVETVVEAARLLRGEGIRIEIVGTGQLLETVEPRARGVEGLALVTAFEPEERIRERLAASHVGLGVFGSTAKAARVVPLKAAFVLSCGRPLVSRDGPAAGDALAGAAVLVPPSDPAALADALRRLRDDRAELERLASAARARYLERFSPPAAAGRLLDAVRGLVGSER
jgi:glycosyltransferase involved in cell wall biosynthesis